MTRDTVSDPLLHKIIEMAGIVSPWMVGRFGKPKAIKNVAETVWRPDREWCDKRDHYLWLVGEAGKMLPKKTAAELTLPTR